MAKASKHIYFQNTFISKPRRKVPQVVGEKNQILDDHALQNHALVSEKEWVSHETRLGLDTSSPLVLLSISLENQFHAFNFGRSLSRNKMIQQTIRRVFNFGRSDLRTKLTTCALCERDWRETRRWLAKPTNWQKRPSRFKTNVRRCSVELWIGCKSWTFDFCSRMQTSIGNSRKTLF